MSAAANGAAPGAPSILAVADAPDGVEKRRRYLALVERFRHFIERTVPPATRVAVVSKGDAELLRLGDRQATHFPRDPSGAYAGWHPASGAHGVELVEAARVDGVQYLAFPATAHWWFDTYAELGAHLLARYRLVDEEEQTGVIYELAAPVPVAADAAVTEGDDEVEQIHGLVTAVLPDHARVLVLAEGAGARCPWTRWLPGGGLRPDRPPPAASAAVDQAGRMADFLVVATSRQPSVAHAGLLEELEVRARPILRHRDVCAVFDLRAGRSTPRASTASPGVGPKWEVDATRWIADVARLVVPRGAPTALVISSAEIHAQLDHALAARLIVTRAAEMRPLCRQIQAWRGGGVAFLILSACALRAINPSDELTEWLDARYPSRWNDSRCLVYDLTGTRPRPQRPTNGRSAG